jgi:hypothetical protein
MLPEKKTRKQKEEICLNLKLGLTMVSKTRIYSIKTQLKCKIHKKLLQRK